MYKIILTTKYFLIDFAVIEVFNFSKKNPKKISNEILEINFEKEKELFDFILNIIYYSRAIQFVKWVKEDETQIDLVGFDLMKRDYLININSDITPVSLIIYCLYLMELDNKKKEFSIIDPYANLGEIIIESALFKPRKPLNIKKRFEFNLINFFDFFIKLPQIKSNSSKFTAISLDNNKFKKIKENINFSSEKIKVSQFDFSWLDVKYKKNEFNFCITSFPLFSNELDFNEFCDKFFYMAEFISKEKICVISRQKIDLKFSRKYKLKLFIKKEIEIENKKYLIYIFE